MAITRSNKRKDLTRNDTSSKADATTSNKCKDLTRNYTSSKADATTPSDTSFELASSVAHSPLFRLSPELRNKIYRLVLFKDCEHMHDAFWTMVDKPSGIKEPDLLSSNKIIRSEASGIFYYENQFHCYVDNFDIAPVLLLQSKFTMPLCDHPMGVEVRIGTGSIPDWKKLVAWLHMCHKGKCAALTVDEEEEFYLPDRAMTRLLESLFAVAVNCPDMTSSMLQKVLDSMRPALGALDRLWLQ
jgi:hypothetical protein